MSDRDLSTFGDLNKEVSELPKGAKKERRAFQEKRADLIREEFPSTQRLDWKRAFQNDRDLFERIWADMVKLGDSHAGRPGPRPRLEPKEALREHLQLGGQDYSMLPFEEAFRILARSMSVRTLSRKVGLGRNYTWQLMTGQRPPDVYAMKQVAQGFKKDPSYFVEYRLHAIVSALADRLEGAPESSINIYRKLHNGYG